MCILGFSLDPSFFFFFFFNLNSGISDRAQCSFLCPVTAHNPAGASNLTYLNLNYSSSKSASFPYFPLSVSITQLWNLRIMFDSLPFLPATLKSLLRLVSSCHLFSSFTFLSHHHRSDIYCSLFGLLRGLKNLHLSNLFGGGRLQISPPKAFRVGITSWIV